ncbi:MAG: sensor histidine kinase [Alkalispirochaeta sp.]
MAIETDRGEETYQIRCALDTAIAARMETEQCLAASLQEKEILLQEIHHRVKNNLQIISSMLSLQRGTVKDSAAQAALDDSSHRVMSMAIVHELLYERRSADSVQLDEYLRNLASALDPPIRRNVAISVDAPAAPLAIDTAIPMGLIVTELITNAIRHAFHGKPSGAITISGSWERWDTLRITVADDGIGLPRGWSVEVTDSLGMRIVAALLSQIGSELTVETGPGTRFSFEVTPAEGTSAAPPTSGSAPEGESARRTPDSPPRASRA